MANQDYVNFELNVEALDGNRLRVTVDDSPVGSVSVEVPNPVTPDEITNIIGLLEGSIQASRSDVAKAARAFGEKLFGGIFSGQVSAAYLASQERAGDAGLRIKLGLDDSGPLASLPWELLRDPRTDYLALSRQTPLVRFPRVLTTRPLVEVNLPLRVLVMISSPTDQEKLDVEGEWAALQEATADLRRRGLLELERLPDAQLVTLQRKLRDGTNYQAFHFIGHSAFDDRTQSGMLAFEDPKTSASVAVSGEALARELSEENSIRLVVMNACQGARANAADPFAGIASSLVARGLPAVVAMQFSISDDASKLFSQEFYQVISEGYPIEAAMSEARRAINSNLNNFEWATPVLYLRAPTGMLFPRRVESQASTGGIREMLLSPRGILIGLLLIVLLAGGGYVLSHLRPGGPNQVTTTPPAPVASDVDLTISSFRITPPHPAPGQHATVAMTIKNQGTTDTGSFKWAWFSTSDNTDQPSISDTVQNLSPGDSQVVKGDFYFGLQHVYQTMAWVDFDNGVPDTNPLNNIKQLAVITTTDPLTVDFTQSANGVPIFSGPIKGDDFRAWDFTISPGPGSDPNCVNANLIVRNATDASGNSVNELVTGKDDQVNTCSNLPIIFTLDQPIGSATVQFVASTLGQYSLELQDSGGNKLTSNSVSATGANQILTLKVPATSTVSNGGKVIFSGPANGSAAIRDVSFGLPSQLPQG